jgi:hypothetical protein
VVSTNCCIAHIPSLSSGCKMSIHNYRTYWNKNHWTTMYVSWKQKLLKVRLKDLLVLRLWRCNETKHLTFVIRANYTRQSKCKKTWLNNPICQFNHQNCIDLPSYKKVSSTYETPPPPHPVIKWPKFTSISLERKIH